MRDSAQFPDIEMGTIEMGTTGMGGGEAIWMFEDDDSNGGGWTPYNESLQSEIESTYQADPSGCLTMHLHPWTYTLDLDKKTQTNVTHPHNKTRKMRRTQLG